VRTRRRFRKDDWLRLGLALVAVTAGLETFAFFFDPGGCPRVADGWRLVYESIIGCWVGAGILFVAGRNGILAYGVVILVGMAATAAAAPIVFINSVGDCFE
jgi:hypothetical protein